MPSFEDSAISQAPPEEVWKLLYDPARISEWWTDTDAVEDVEPVAGETRFTRRFTRFGPLPQRLHSTRSDGRIVVTCLESHTRWEWRLEPIDGGDATRIDVLVDVPIEFVELLEYHREVITASLRGLAELSERQAGGG